MKKEIFFTSKNQKPKFINTINVLLLICVICILGMGYIVFHNLKSNISTEIQDLAKRDMYKSVEKLKIEKQEFLKELNLVKLQHKQKTEKLAKQEHRIKNIHQLLTELAECDNKITAFAIGFSETRMKSNVVHKSSNSNFVYGKGGIDTYYWGNKLKKKKIKVDSLQAIDFVYKEYLREHNNTKLALKSYKGTIKNEYSYNLTVNYIRIIENSSNYKNMLNAFYKVQDLKRELV